jgi:hypothetical protein
MLQETLNKLIRNELLSSTSWNLNKIRISASVNSYLGCQWGIRELV